jgi:hypothetical protein
MKGKKIKGKTRTPCSQGLVIFLLGFRKVFLDLAFELLHELLQTVLEPLHVQRVDIALDQLLQF